MPSTYTTNNGLEKIGTGEQSGTWGDTTNRNFDILDQALDGLVTITATDTGSSGSPNSLPITDGTLSDGRNRLIIITDGGDLGGSVYYQLTPADAEKIVFLRNSLSGSRDLILFQGTYNSARDLIVPAGKDVVVKFSGTGTSTAVVAPVFADLSLDAATIGSADINGGTIDGVTIGVTSVATVINVDNLKLDGNTLSSTNTNGNVVLAPNGDGDVQLDADTVRVGDSNTDVTITTNGTGDLTLNTNGGTNSGSIEIQDGVNTNIIVTANGTGKLELANGDITTSASTGSDAAGTDLTIQAGASTGNAAGGDMVFQTTPAGAGSGTNLNSYTTVLTLTDDSKLKIGTSTAVSSILDEDDMSSNSATALSTQQSIKAYVDAQVGTVDTLAEVLGNGNTTGGTNISITSGDKIVTGSNDNLVLEPGGTGNVNISADTLAVIGAEGESAALVLSADEADDNPDIWRIVSNTGNTLGIENQISGSTVSHLTITPNATVANSTFAVAGTVTSAGLTVDGTTTLGTGAWPTSSVGKSGGRVAIVSSTENQYLLVANTNGTVAADNGATLYLGATGTTDTANLAAAQIFGGKSNATSGDFESYLSFKTSASNGTTTEAIRINSAQKVIIGATSTRGTYGLTVAEPSDGIRVFGTVNGGMDAIHFDQARGSVASPTASNADGDGSYLSFSSYDGTNFDDIGSLAVVTDGAQDAGRMIFRTTPTGSSQTERMRLNSNGHLAVGFKATIGGGQSTTSPDAVFTVQDAGAAVGKITATFGADENTNTLTDNTSKEARVGIPHYDTDEEPAALFYASSSSSNNNIIFGGGTSRLNAATAISFRTAANTTTATGTEALRIDSSQRILIGGTSSVPMGDTNHQVQLQGDNFGKTSNVIQRYGDSTAGGMFAFAKSRNATIGSQTIVQNDDQLGKIRWYGSNGSNFTYYAAEVSASVDGAPSTSADMPGRLVFSTTSDGAGSPVERMRISQNGDVDIGQTGGGVKLAVAGAVGPQNGTAAAPTHTFYSDSDTGVYRAGVNALGFSTGGSNAMVIDSSQRVLIGHTSSIPIEGNNQKLQLVGSDADDGITIARFNNDFGPYLSFGRSGSGTIGNYAAVPVNDELGRIQWGVADGTDMTSVGASISAFTELLAASDDTPARLVFKTTASGASSPTTAMTIDRSQRLMVGKTISGLANTGHEFGSDGYLYHTRAGDVMWINRTAGSSGTLITFMEGGGTVGRIQSRSTDYLNVQIGSLGTGITGTSSHTILPSVNNARSNNTNDLGDNDYRWKDLYLSGNANVGDRLLVNGATSNAQLSVLGDASLRAQNVQVAVNGHTAIGFFNASGTDVGGISVSASGVAINLGGTSADNTLDDYEEGTFDITIYGSSSGSTTYSQSANAMGQYTKIGQLVHMNIVLNNQTFPTFTGDIRVSLPFTQKSSNSTAVEDRSGDVYFYPLGSWDNVANFMGFVFRIGGGSSYGTLGLLQVDADRQTTAGSTNTPVSGDSGVYFRTSIVYETDS